MKLSKLQNIDITAIINQIADEVNEILNERQEDRYFYGIVLLASLIENLLKHMMLIDALWKETQETNHVPHLDICKDLLVHYFEEPNFYRAIDMAYERKLVTKKLKRRLHNFREGRNDLIHQCWLYAERNNKQFLRAELIGVAKLSSGLIRKLNKLSKEVGVLDMYYPTDYIWGK